MRHQGEGERAAEREREGREIGDHMKECISQEGGEIDWDREMREWIERGGGARKGGRRDIFLL